MGRGPSYPYVGLEEAISFTRKVYDYAKRGPAPVDSLITEALKYSATSSTGIKILAALRSFGLIEDAAGGSGKSVKITSRTVRILFDDPESTERKDEIKKAALSPKWYEYCWKKWGADMPLAMKHNLIVEHGFIDSTVESFLKDYRATIAYAGLLDDKLFGVNEGSAEKSKDSPKVGDYVQWESHGVLKMRAAKKLTHYSPKGDFAFVEGEPTGIPIDEVILADAPETPEELGKPIMPPNPLVPSVPVKSVAQEDRKMQTDVIAIGSNSITIHIQWPTEITQEAYDDLVDYLGILQKRAKRAIKTAPSDPAIGVPFLNEKTSQEGLGRSS